MLFTFLIHCCYLHHCATGVILRLIALICFNSIFIYIFFTSIYFFFTFHIYLWLFMTMCCSNVWISPLGINKGLSYLMLSYLYWYFHFHLQMRILVCFKHKHSCAKQLMHCHVFSYSTAHKLVCSRLKHSKRNQLKWVLSLYLL